MKKHGIKDKELLNYANGKCTPEEHQKITEMMENSEDLREEVAMLSTLKQTIKVPQPDEAKLRQMEQNVIREWRKEGKTTVNSNSYFKPVFATAMMVALISISILVYQFVIPTEETLTQKEDAIAFDTGSKKSTGVSVPVAMEHRFGPVVLPNRLTNSEKAHAGDVINTGDKGLFQFTFGSEVSLTILPKTSIVFHEYKGQIAPYIRSGKMACEMKHKNAKPFFILGSNIRVQDIGTKFAVEVNLDGSGRVDVLDGAVWVERPQYEPIIAGKGQSVSWTNIKNEPALRDELSSPNGFDVAQKILFPEIKPSMDHEKIMAQLHIPEKLRPKSGNEEKVVEVESTLFIPIESKSWENTLGDLSTLEKSSILSFYAMLENQMKSGYTIRAIKNLQEFIDDNPGKKSEKAFFLLGQCYQNLQENKNAKTAYMNYIMKYPEGSWNEKAKNLVREIDKENE